MKKVDKILTAMGYINRMYFLPEKAVEDLKTADLLDCHIRYKEIATPSVARKIARMYLIYLHRRIKNWDKVLQEYSPKHHRTIASAVKRTIT